ncbi:hypothetical protein [Paenibacillus donghaensis]|uniref:Uncharacterized protein n=1 Tax=Paenibacillus donghaensis TaxID=414771 RepID=A0A2Z2KTG1_9BACL|nr:hypothetical protein [Paenibacillus donghaensis]ASA22708.1 hypothetical protein B9T62_19065 [Paenibacillus donghaensis]
MKNIFKLPDLQRAKIDEIMELRNRANRIEQEVIKWFEDNGFNIQEEHFLLVADKLSNSEGTSDDIEQIIQDAIRQNYTESRREG